MQNISPLSPYSSHKLVLSVVAYILSITCLYFFSTAWRFSFIVGPSSPPPMVKSLGKIVNFLIFAALLGVSLFTLKIIWINITSLPFSTKLDKRLSYKEKKYSGNVSKSGQKSRLRNVYLCCHWECVCSWWVMVKNWIFKKKGAFSKTCSTGFICNLVFHSNETRLVDLEWFLGLVLLVWRNKICKIDFMN